jgi:2-dehydro-3-deoxy-L-rhamnonate dehydrogenase (NAD+)
MEIDVDYQIVPGRFTGKTVVVFGGGGDLGLDLAIRAGREGAAIAVLDNRAEKLAAANGALGAAGVSKYHSYTVDVCDSANLEDRIQTVLADFDEIDYVVNTVGIVHGPTSKGKTGWQASVDDFSAVMNVNFFGAVRITQAVMPHFIGRKAGKLLHYASIAGREGNPMMSVYSASKGALIAYVKSTGKELAGFNTRNDVAITLNALAPCTVDSEMVREQCTEEEIQMMRSKIPAGRLIEAWEVTEVALAHLALQTVGVNGQTLDATLGRFSV